MYLHNLLGNKALSLCCLIFLSEVVVSIYAATSETPNSNVDNIYTTNNNENSNNNNNNNNNDHYDLSEWSERNQLLLYTLQEFALLSNFTVTHGAEVLRNVLKEVSELKEPTASLQAYLRNFSDYVVRAEHLNKPNDNEQLSELFELAVQFTELVEQHNTTATTTTTVRENVTTESMLLEMMLKKNGLDKLHVDFLERFLVFINAFNKRMDNYLGKLTDEERANEHKMIEWYRMLNDETNAEKKVGVFSKFFELYAG